MFRDTKRDVVFPIAGSLILAGLLVGGGLLYAAIVGGSSDRLIAALLIDAIMVVGIQVYIGNTGVLSFGHVGFGAVAGYAFALFAISPERKNRWIEDAPLGLNEIQVHPAVATLIAVIATVIVALFVGIGLARSGAKSGAVAATVITLALLFVTHEIAANWVNLTGGNRAPLSFGVGETLGAKWPIYLALLASILAGRLFAQSRMGRLAKAAREDNLAARAMGVNPATQQLMALVISVVIVAVAASIRVFEIGNIAPRFFFFDYALLTLVMLIVGGRNSLTGGLVGVVVISFAREFARRLSTDGYEFVGVGLDGAPLGWIFREGLPVIVLGLAMLGFMVLKPDGLLRDWELDRWLHQRFGSRQEGKPTRLASAEVAGFEAGTSVLNTENLTVDFGGFRALDSASVTITQQEVVGLIGPNGAGKTTLVNAITGMVTPSNGSFSIGELDLTDAPSHTIARAGLVRTFQNLRLFPLLTVRENVEVSSLMAEREHPERTHPDVDQIIELAGLWEHRDRRAGELDYGNSRRLELARAAAMLPEFLLLDEPTSGMSDTESVAMIEQVRSMADAVGAGVLVIDHDLAFITGIADRIYCLDQGRVLAEGTPDEIQANPAVQAAYLGSASVG